MKKVQKIHAGLNLPTAAFAFAGNLLLMTGPGCTAPDNTISTTSAANAALPTGQIYETSVTTTVATEAQCPAGGIVVETFTDLEGNGVYNSQYDPILSSTPVCNGVAGVGVVFNTLPATLAQCPNGGSVLVMASDTLGTGVYSVSDEHQQSTLVCNGAPGAAAPTSPFSIVQTISPCGSASSPWKEVLLCMADGSILADFSADMAGDETRLAFIPTGTYEDTDASGCIFSVENDGKGGLAVSWGAGSNSYATWKAGSTDCANTSTPSSTPSATPSSAPSASPSPSPSVTPSPTPCPTPTPIKLAS